MPVSVHGFVFELGAPRLPQAAPAGGAQAAPSIAFRLGPSGRFGASMLAHAYTASDQFRLSSQGLSGHTRLATPDARSAASRVGPLWR